MTYEVGTRIDLTYMNTKLEVSPGVIKDFKREYETGTKILFVKVMEGITQAIVVTPRGSVALA